jgi:hypothetical protein
MKIINRLYVIPAIAIGLGVFAAPVFAEGGGNNVNGSVSIKTSDTNVSSETTTKADESSSDTAIDNTDQTAVEHKPKAQAAKTTTETTSENDTAESSIRAKGEKEVTDRRKTHKVHTAVERQKFCNIDKNGLNTKFNSIQTNAQRVEDKIGGVYTKAVDFSSAHNLQPIDYAALVTSVASDKTATDGAIAALIAPKIDCSSATVATDVATFKVTADQARTDLEAYRKDVWTLIVAIKAALQTTQPVAGASSTTTTSGGTN